MSPWVSPLHLEFDLFGETPRMSMHLLKCPIAAVSGQRIAGILVFVSPSETCSAPLAPEADDEGYGSDGRDARPVHYPLV